MSHWKEIPPSGCPRHWNSLHLIWETSQFWLHVKHVGALVFQFRWACDKRSPVDRWHQVHALVYKWNLAALLTSSTASKGLCLYLVVMWVMTPVWQDQMSLFTIANHLIRLVFPLNKDIQIQSHTFSSLQIATPKSLHWLTAEVFAHTSGVVVNISSFIWGVGYPEFVLLFSMTQQTQLKWVQVPRLAVTDRKTVTQSFLFCQNAAQWFWKALTNNAFLSMAVSERKVAVVL